MTLEVSGQPHANGLAAQSYPKLAALAGYVDRDSGIAEDFLTPVLGGARTVAVLSSPVGPLRGTTWVLCHSFALEQIYLQPLEVPFVRSLTAAGYEVLRYHSQGYGDSDLPAGSVSLQSHLRDAADAVELLRRRGATRIGLIGFRFGGSVAALAADRVDADALILWEPVLKGRAFLNALARRAIVSQLTVRANQSSPAGSTEDPLQRIDDEDTVDLQGFPLTRTSYEQILNMDLLMDLNRFAGEALVVQISRSSEQRPDLKRLVKRLGEIGGSPAHEVVSHPRPQLFGGPRYRPTGTGEKRDTQADLLAALTAATIGWCTKGDENAEELSQ